jgi:hypothetical protein
MEQRSSSRLAFFRKGWPGVSLVVVLIALVLTSVVFFRPSVAHAAWNGQQIEVKIDPSASFVKSIYLTGYNQNNVYNQWC